MLPGMEMLEVVLVALETFPFLLLALNWVEATLVEPCSTEAGAQFIVLALPQRKLLKHELCLGRFLFPTRRDSRDPLHKACVPTHTLGEFQTITIRLGDRVDEEGDPEEQGLH